MNNITLTPVLGSSMVCGKRYFSEVQILRIEYIGTGQYDYHNVTQQEYDSLMTAGSFGKQLKKIIAGKQCEKIS